MALIPPDAGLLMRLQNDATILHPTTPVQGIPTDLPDLRVGQLFSARIQEVLPDNTFKALVAGKQVTLQLPEGAKAGDTLDLVVIDRTPRSVIARLAEPTAGGTAAAADRYTTLSSTAKMIGGLLLPEGETPQPATLNRGQPLLSSPAASAADLVPTLQKAVVQSGLFYESHQAQWVAGKLPLDQILHEPQGRLSAPSAFALAASGGTLAPAAEGRLAAAVQTEPAFQVGTPSQAEGPHETLPLAQAVAREATTANALRLDTIARREERIDAPSANSQQAMTSTAQPMPNELRPIVQQQLDAVATQRLLWHGEAWPNQPLEWEIIREDESNAATAEEIPASWRTSLRLDTPRLGHIEASLHLTGDGITMRIAAGDDASAADLRQALPELAASLEAAGIKLLSAQVRHGGE